MEHTSEGTSSSWDELVTPALEKALGDFGLLTVLEEFNTQGVTWAFPRYGQQMLSALQAGPDVDLWVSARSFRAAQEILEGHNFRVVGGTTRPGTSGLVRFRPPNDRTATVLEIHVGSYWSPFTRLLSEDTISRGLERGKFNFFGACDLLLISTVRIAVRGDLVKSRLDFARKKWADSTSDSLRAEWRKCSEGLLGSSAKILEHLLANSAGSGKLGQLVFPTAGFLHSANRWAYLAAPFFRRSRKMRASFFGNRLAVAAVGVDGAGKSSVLTAARGILERDGASSIYLYAGRTRSNSFFVRTVKQLIFKWRPEYREDLKSDGGSEGGPRSQHPRTPGLLVTFGSLVLYTLDYWMRFGWVLLRPSGGSEVLLIDRGPDDLVTVTLPRMVVRFFQHLAPKTQLVIFCDAPAEVIRERKRERSLESIRIRQDLYARHISRPLVGQLATRIDTSKSLESSAQDVVAAIWLANLVHIGDLDSQLFTVLLHAEKL